MLSCERHRRSDGHLSVHHTDIAKQMLPVAPPSNAKKTINRPCYLLNRASTPRLTLLLMSPCECVTCSADTRDLVHILCVQPYNCRTYFIVVCIMLEIDPCHDFHMTSVHGLALEPIIST